MTTIDIPLPASALVQRQNLFVTAVSLIFVYLFSILVTSLYNAFIGPLSRFPGPKSRAFSIWPSILTNVKGDDNLDLPALHREYGDAVRIAPNQISFVGDGQKWKDIYGFRKPGQHEVSKDYAFYGENINRVPGLLAADTELHARQRKIVSHAFSDKALKEQSPLLMHWAQLLRTKLGEQAARGGKTDLLMMLNCTTFDIMGDLTFAEPLYMLENSAYIPWVKMIFGSIKFGTYIRCIKMLGDFSKRLIGEILYRVPSMRQKQLKHWKYTTDRVDRRLAKTPDRPDFFTRILAKSDGPGGLSIEEMYSLAGLFMVAGTETTATALSGIMYNLMKNREYFKLLSNEIRAAFNSMDDMTLDELARLPQLEATIKEGIRMYPPVPIGLPRVSPPGGMMVGEHFVPEGTKVAVHQLSTYRDNGNFKEPFQFRPERWLGDAEFADDKRDAFEPFAVGPRNCMGKNLAWHEMRLLLATIVLHFDAQLLPESERWMDQHVFSLWEKSPLWCKLTKVGSW